MLFASFIFESHTSRPVCSAFPLDSARGVRHTSLTSAAKEHPKVCPVVPITQRNITDYCAHHHLSCIRAPSQIDTLFLLRSHKERSGSSFFYYTIHPSTHIHHPYYLHKLFPAIDTRGPPTHPH